MSRPYVMRKGVSSVADLIDGSAALAGLGVAKVYYVNGVTWTNGFAAGDDGNSGLTIDDPLHTITAALALCTNEGNDVIVVLDYWAATGETWPIVVDKTLVSIIGVGHFNNSNWINLYSAGAGCIDITGSDVYIEGIGFMPKSTSPGVAMDSGCMRVWLNKCNFLTGTYGVQLEAGDTASTIEITNCHFIASLTTGGIGVVDDPAFMYIAGNYFDRLTGDCINISAGAGHRIVDNDFSLKSNGEGLAITLGSSVARAHVARNVATFGTATTTSPYDDAGTVTTNGWGPNYLNLTLINPA